MRTSFVLEQNSAMSFAGSSRKTARAALLGEDPFRKMTFIKSLVKCGSVASTGCVSGRLSLE